jgi:hypothetical protein
MELDSTAGGLYAAVSIVVDIRRQAMDRDAIAPLGCCEGGDCCDGTDDCC